MHRIFLLRRKSHSNINPEWSIRSQLQYASYPREQEEEHPWNRNGRRLALCLLDYLTAASRHKAVMLTLSTVVREILRGVCTRSCDARKTVRYIVELKSRAASLRRLGKIFRIILNARAKCLIARNEIRSHAIFFHQLKRQFAQII